MSDFEIPIENIEPSFTLSIEISEKEYIIELSFNSENDFWTISLFTAGKIPIFQSKKIVLNYNLFSFCSHPLLPSGSLRAIDTSNTLRECQYEDLGNRVKLIYSK